MIKSLKLASYKGFSNTTIEFSNITCIIGENGTGKSTIIEAIQGLLSSNAAIGQNYCKVGINDKNATSLSFVFQDGSKLSKNIQNPNLEKKSRDSLPKCLTTIIPIETRCSFPVKNNPDYDKPIKNQNIGDIAWQNILRHCNFTLRTAAESTTTYSDTSRFQKEYIVGISKKFTNDFNNVLEGSIGRKYEFEVVFENDGNQLVVQLHISYKESDRESDKQSSWVDLNYESIGFRTLITLCSYLLNDQDKSETIFVMDEPFTNIHPKAQRHVSRMLQSLSQRFQIIYATHSPHLVPKRDNIICTLTETAGDLSICKFGEYPLYLFYDLSPLALDTVEKIKGSDSAINVCVEGKTDDRIYRRLFEIEGISDRIDITKVGGSSNFKQYMEAFAVIDKPSLFILDPNENIGNLKRLRELIAEHDNLFLLELTYKEDNHVKKGIENLIPNHIIEKAFEKEQGAIKLIRSMSPEKHVEEYIANKKEQLAEFFVNEADHADYQFFNPVIEKINLIREKFRI